MAFLKLFSGVAGTIRNDIPTDTAKPVLERDRQAPLLDTIREFKRVLCDAEEHEFSSADVQYMPAKLPENVRTLAPAELCDEPHTTVKFCDASHAEGRMIYELLADAQRAIGIMKPKPAKDNYVDQYAYLATYFKRSTERDGSYGVELTIPTSKIAALEQAIINKIHMVSDNPLLKGQFNKAVRVHTEMFRDLGGIKFGYRLMAPEGDPVAKPFIAITVQGLREDVASDIAKLAEQKEYRPGEPVLIDMSMPDEQLRDVSRALHRSKSNASSPGLPGR